MFSIVNLGCNAPISSEIPVNCRVLLATALCLLAHDLPTPHQQGPSERGKTTLRQLAHGCHAACRPESSWRSRALHVRIAAPCMSPHGDEFIITFASGNCQEHFLSLVCLGHKEVEKECEQEEVGRKRRGRGGEEEGRRGRARRPRGRGRGDS